MSFPAARSIAVALTMFFASGLNMATATDRAGAAPEQPFARLRISAPSRIITGQPFAVTFRVQNTGEAKNYVRAAFTLPVGVLLAAPVPDGCFAAFDRNERRFLFEGPTPPGWQGECRVELAAAPDMSNHATFFLEASAPPNAYANESATGEIIDPPAPALFSVAGIGVTSAGAAVLLYLAVAAAFVAGRARSLPGGERFRYAQVMTPVAVVACVGFLHLFAILAWDDWRTLSRFQETRCQALDGLVKLEPVGSAADNGLLTHSRTDMWSHTPVFSLRYQHGGRTLQSLGFSTGSRLSYSPQELAGIMGELQRQGETRCWVDPEDPKRAIVLRGFGGAYIFAPLPLLVLACVGWLGAGGLRFSALRRSN